MLLLFRKGEKGLAAINDYKWYYPDRKSNINAEGVWDCHITRDKEKYAFVTGKKVQVPNYKEYSEQIQNLVAQEVDETIECDHVNVVQIGNDHIISIVEQSSIGDIAKLGFFSANGFITVVKYQLAYHKSMIRFYGNKKIADGWEEFKNACKLNVYSDITDPLLIAAAALGVCKLSIFGDMNLDDFTLYAGKIMKIKASGAYDLEEAFAYDAQNNKLLPINLSECKGLPAKTIKAKDVLEWMESKHIGLKYGTPRLDDLLELTVNCMGTEITVVYLNGFNLLKIYKNLTEEQKQTVEESFRNLAAFRKNVAKNITAKNVKELVKLSDKNILKLNM